MSSFKVKITFRFIVRIIFKVRIRFIGSGIRRLKVRVRLKLRFRLKVRLSFGVRMRG